MKKIANCFLYFFTIVFFGGIGAVFYFGLNRSLEVCPCKILLIVLGGFIGWIITYNWIRKM